MMTRHDMAHGTRWDGHRGPLRWTAFRSKVAMRDVELIIRLPGKHRGRLTLKLDWWKP